MNKGIKLLRDTLLLIFPALLGYLFIALFVKHPDLVNYELIPIFSLFIGGVIIGWLFRKEHGDSSIRTCLNLGNKLYICFFLHSLYLTFIITCITVLSNLLTGSSLSIISSAPFLMFIKISAIALFEKWICIYAPMIMGNWLFGWWEKPDSFKA